MSAADGHAAAVARLAFLIRTDFRARFVGSPFSLVWLLLLPLIQLALFALVFGVIFRARVPGLEGLGYTGFLALGLWPWFAMSEAITRATTAVTDNTGLVTKVAIESWMLVAARVANAFFVHGVGFVLVVVILVLLDVPMHGGQLGWVALGWLLMLPLALALGLAVAVIQVFLRDTQQLIPMLLSAWMFLSPILYDASMAPGPIRGWFALNPVATVTEMIRDSLLFGRGPEHPWLGMLALALIATLATGVFVRLHRRLEDFL